MTQNEFIPFDDEAERSVLGSILVDYTGEALIKVVDVLKPDDFYSSINQKVFEVILDMEADGTKVDIVTLTSELKRKNLIEKIGGPFYITDLINIVTTSLHAETYAKIVKEKKAQREVQRASLEMQSAIASGDSDIDDILDKTEQTIFSISNRRNSKRVSSLSSLLPESIDRIKLLKEGKIEPGTPTGFKGIDSVLAGLHKSDLIVLGARPSKGKSALSINIAVNVAKQGKGVAIFSLEMSREQVVDRILAISSGVDLQIIRTGKCDSDKDIEKLESTSAQLKDYKIFIDDTPSPTIMEIRRACRKMKAENKDLGLVIVDYLQLIRPRKEDGNTVSQITEISRGLKIIAKELDLPVLALSQLSRSIEQRDNTTPKLSDLRDSGSIEADADIVMFIGDVSMTEQVNSKYGDGYVLRQILVQKNRNGALGANNILFNNNLASFENIKS